MKNQASRDWKASKLIIIHLYQKKKNNRIGVCIL